jgi:hypothetical protein
MPLTALTMGERNTFSRPVKPRDCRTRWKGRLKTQRLFHASQGDRGRLSHQLGLKERHHLGVERRVKRRPVKPRLALADKRCNLGEGFCARRQEIKMIGVRNNMIGGRRGQRGPHDFGVIRAGKNVIVPVTPEVDLCGNLFQAVGRDA